MCACSKLIISSESVQLRVIQFQRLVHSTQLAQLKFVNVKVIHPDVMPIKDFLGELIRGALRVSLRCELDKDLADPDL